MTVTLPDSERAELERYRSGKPFHYHTCPKCEQHSFCDSPYCSSNRVLCIKCGGEAPRA